MPACDCTGDRNHWSPALALTKMATFLRGPVPGVYLHSGKEVYLLLTLALILSSCLTTPAVGRESRSLPTTCSCSWTPLGEGDLVMHGPLLLLLVVFKI